ncbi:MAG: class E sortase [Methanobrevibacter sp.]|jgi:LPXTG-site transpeptidase (sortase) family protein|nr:class E sortase [Candidatus Methanovirga basalitermitum]
MKIRTLIIMLIIGFISIYAMQEVTYFSMKEVNEYNFNGNTLIIPKINLKEHLNFESLENGVLIDNTSSEPSKGIVILSGHRTLLGSPFLRLNELVHGDNVILNWQGIGKVNYEVDKSYIVNPDHRINLGNGSTILYMVTCDPIGSLAHRLIVESSFIDLQPLDTNVKIDYTMYIILIILGFFIVGSIISYFYPVKEDRKFVFAEIVIITLILIGLFIHPISPNYFSFLGQLYF